MKARVRSAATAVAATAAMGFVGVASASAAEFESNNPGGKIKGHATSTQVFKAEEGGGAVECNAEPGGTAVAKSSTWEVDVEYGSCTAFGEPATFSTAALTFNIGSASVGVEPVDGTVKWDNTTTISVPLAGCEIKVGPAGNEALKTVEFTNSGKELTANLKLVGITDKVMGGFGFCGKEGTNHSGTYTGSLTFAVEGGSFKVD
ncbi:MAG: hypothetical protein ACYCU0_06235 [Solirubrobacteraceae bacterium]